MSEYDWAADQGDKWLAQLSGLEAMMKEIDVPLLEALPLVNIDAGDVPIRIADIASGGGGTTFEIEKRAPKSSVIHGFDISSALVESANARADMQGSRATFQTANLQTTILPREKYDYLVSRFGIMFFDDPRVAFGNIRNWLKPEGQFAFAVWGDPKQNPWVSSLQEIASRYVDFAKPERSAPGPFRYADTELLLQELNTAGFKDVKLKDWRGQLPLGGGLNAADAISFALNVFTIGESLHEAGASVFEEVKTAMINMLKDYEKDGKVLMDCYVHIVSGGRH